MINYQKGAFVAIILFLNCSKIFSQQATDGKFIFKTWFFLERQNEVFMHGNKFDVKSDSLFNFFDSVIDLRIDTLKNKGFSNNFIFLSIAPYKNNVPFHDSAIIYKSFKTTPNSDVHVGIPINNCNGYVLCINNRSGRSYRIQGFYGNDFLNLLQEVKEEFNNNAYNKEQKQILSTNIFLKKYSVDGIDFKCIFQGLTSAENESKKYPCLANCRNAIGVIH